MRSPVLLLLCCCLHLLVRAQVYIPAGAQNQVTGEMVVADSLVNNGKLWLVAGSRFHFTGQQWREGARQNTYGQGLVLFTGAKRQAIIGNLQLYRALVNGAGVAALNELAIDSALHLEGGKLHAAVLKSNGAAWIIRTGGSVGTVPQGLYNLFYPQYLPIEAGAEAQGKGLRNLVVDNIAGVTLRSDLAAGGSINGVGTLIFAGNRQQSLRADAGFSLGQLFVQNASGLSLQSSGFIQNMLRMDAGKLYLNNQLLTLYPDAEIAGYNKDRYIVAGTNLGRLRRQNFTGTQVFPLGTADAYLPVSVTHDQAAPFTLGLFSGVTANALAGGPPATQKPFMVDMVWITESTAPNGQVSMEWQPQLEGTRFKELSADQVGLYAYRGNWQLTANKVAVNKDANRVLVQLPANGRLAIGAKDTVAANLQVSLTARRLLDDDAVSVHWSLNMRGVRTGAFYLEHSIDGVQFNEWQQFPAIGLHIYAQIHRQPVKGINYYRVKYRSASGLIVYSNVAVVSNLSNGDHIEAFPNPTTGPTTLRYTTAAAGPAQLRIFNTQGRLVQSTEVQLQAGVNNIKMDIGALPAATYFVQVRYEAIKLVKQPD